MRTKIINFLKHNPIILNCFWFCARIFLEFIGLFVKIDSKMIIFSSLGGRKFDDSPKAIYDEICSRKEFDDYKLIWAFVEPSKFNIPRGEKVKIDTFSFFITLLKSKIWIGNSEIDRGIGLKRKGTIKVETWHGTPIKKIGGEENANAIGGKTKHVKKKDNDTIRCAQSKYDQEIFARVFNATKESILISDLPRNDKLLNYTENEIENIKKKLNIDKDKKVILYVPTYREYLVTEDLGNYIAPPIDLKKWEDVLGDKYVLLFRAHYAVNKVMNIETNKFIRNVSDYPILNDLFIISNMIISDYSGCFMDYAVLDRPMFCFAYDLEEYSEKRGLYLDLKKELPCNINKNEDELLHDIVNMNEKKSIEKVKKFHKKYVPNPGHGSKIVVDEILKKLNNL